MKDLNVNKTNFGSKVGLDINLNLKRNELFTPPSHNNRQPDGSKLEFWFIIDCSGSMGGISGSMGVIQLIMLNKH